MTNQTTHQAETMQAKGMFLYFYPFYKRRVVDEAGESLGKVWDIAVALGEVYPKCSHLILKRGAFKKSYASIQWALVTVAGSDIVIRQKKAEIQFAPAPTEYEFLLRRDILDQQVVDTFNHKVRRVNDIHLLKVDHDLVVAHVDIALRGLIRRLGWERPVDAFLSLIAPRSRYLTTEELISWKYIQPVAMNPASMTIKLAVSEKQLLSIPPADWGEIIFDLDVNQRMGLLRSLDLKTKARIFENLEFEQQNAIVRELDKKELAEIVGAMSSDEATDLLESLPSGTVKNLLTLIESTRAKKLSTLLGYSSDSAGGLMTTDYVALSETMTVEQGIDHIKTKTKEFDVVPYIYLVDDKHHLKGVTTVRRFLFADPKEGVMSTAFPKTLFVYLNKDVKEVAYYMDKYKVSSIPVIDEQKILHGVITMDDILSQVISIAWRKRPRVKQGL